MINKKLYKKISYVLLWAICIFVVSCQKEDKLNTIRYVSATTDSIIVYIGSAKGGVLLPKKRSASSITGFNSKFEDLTNTTIVFDRSQIQITKTGNKPEVYLYMFEKDSLFTNRGGAWINIGHGEASNLEIVQHYFYAKTDTLALASGQVAPSRSVNIDSVAANSPFGSLKAMLSPSDTLFWCTRRSIFR